MTYVYYLRDFTAAQAYVERTLELSATHGFVFFEGLGSVMRGSERIEAGQVEEGIEEMIRGRGSMEATGIRAFRPWALALLAEEYGKAGQAQDGLGVVAEVLELTEQTGERYYEAESHRIKGDLLRLQGDEPAAEASFHKSLEVARHQQAKSWELRAAMSLARLWQKQGKSEEARELLANVYNWFTEGFDTADLRDAKALLEELSGD